MSKLGLPGKPPRAFLDPLATPALLGELSKRGYDDEAIRGIMGGNFLRLAAAVWRCGSIRRNRYFYRHVVADEPTVLEWKVACQDVDVGAAQVVAVMLDKGLRFGMRQMDVEL